MAAPRLEPTSESTSGTFWGHRARRGRLRSDHRRAKCAIYFMPGGRLELPRPCGQRILSRVGSGRGDPAGANGTESRTCRGPCCGVWDTRSHQDTDRRRTVPAGGRVAAKIRADLSDSVRLGHARPLLTRFPPVEEKLGTSVRLDRAAVWKFKSRSAHLCVRDSVRCGEKRVPVQIARHARPEVASRTNFRMRSTTARESRIRIRRTRTTTGWGRVRSDPAQGIGSARLVRPRQSATR
jgi:hypothetical protein